LSLTIDPSEANALILPWQDSRSNMYMALDGALTRVAIELGEHYDRLLSQEIGGDWLARLSRERGTRINISDPGFVFKEPNQNTQSVTRITLPKTFGFYKLLSDCSRIRNQCFHRELEGTLLEVSEAVEKLFNLALDIPLPDSSRDLGLLAHRLKEISVGKVFVPDSETSRLERLEQERQATLEEKLAEERFQLRELATDVEDLHSERAAAEIRILELQALGESDRAELERSRIELAEMQVELIEKEELLVQERVASEKRKQFASEAAKMLQSILQAKRESLPSESQVEVEINGRGVNPGEAWPYDKGARRLTLFVSSRELIETDSKVPLSDKHGQKAHVMASAWLETKPAGGRVFVDIDGDACCFIGEDLIYLGNIHDWLG